MTENRYHVPLFPPLFPQIIALQPRHLHSKGFLDAERHIPREIGLAIEQLDNVGRETRNAIADAVTVKPVASIISVRMNRGLTAPAVQ